MTVTTDDLASPMYRALLRERYTQKGWGGSGHHHAGVVADFAHEIGAKSVLDYGCGRGTLKTAMDSLYHKTNPRHITVSEYDPGIVGKDVLPDPADLVVATDVLEHVEPDRVAVVLRHVRSLSRLGTFMIIALTPAKMALPDGRNAHLIVRPKEWWLDMLGATGFDALQWKMAKGLWVWA